MDHYSEYKPDFNNLKLNRALDVISYEDSDGNGHFIPIKKLYDDLPTIIANYEELVRLANVGILAESKRGVE